MAHSYSYGTRRRRAFNQARCFYNLRLVRIPPGWEACEKLAIECVLNKPENLDDAGDSYVELLKRFEVALLKALAAQGVSPIKKAFAVQPVLDGLSDDWNSTTSSWRERESEHWRRLINAFLLSRDYQEEYERKSVISPANAELEGCEGPEFFNKLYEMHAREFPDRGAREREHKDRLDNPHKLSTL